MKCKTLIAIVALWITSSAVWADSVFTATIISIMDEGQAALLSVEPVDPVQGAVNPPRAYSTVYVRGNFLGGVDGSRIKVMGCVETGTYQYTTALGGLATVRAFASNHLILLSRPR
jgi:hypothetical protein